VEGREAADADLEKIGSNGLIHDALLEVVRGCDPEVGFCGMAISPQRAAVRNAFCIEKKFQNARGGRVSKSSFASN
jgi:hypothetical protein